MISALDINIGLYSMGTGRLADVRPVQRLCSVASVSYSLSLNDIPMLKADIPLGVAANTDPNNKYSPLYDDFIQEAIDKRILVGIYVEPSKKDFVVHEESDRPAQNKFNTGGAFCIFIGYIVAQTISRNQSGISGQINIVHWLFDLSAVSATRPMFTPGTSDDLANASTKYYSLVGGTPTSFATLRRTELKGNETIWGAYKKLLTYSAKELDYFRDRQALSGTKELVERAMGALDACIETKDALKWNDTWDIAINNKSIFNVFISNLYQVDASKFGNATIWNIMLGNFFRNFNLSICPGITKAYVIPTPGFCTTQTDFTPIYLSEYSGIDVSIPRVPLIGSVVVVGNYKGGQGTNTSLNKSIPYPLTNNGEPIVLINTPQWMTNFKTWSVLNAWKGIDDITFSKLDAQKNALKVWRKDKRNTTAKIAENVYSYAKTMYYMLLFSRRTAVVTCPLRFDLLPGTNIVLDLEVDPLMKTWFGKEVNGMHSTKMYATISSINYVISSAPSAGMTITLINIRSDIEQDRIEAKEADDGSAFIQPMFLNVWNNVKAEVYAFEEV